MWYTVDVYDKKWKVVSSFELNNANFSEDKINLDLIHEYYLLQRSNARYGVAHTKTRSEVAGSGKKLYKQKGTGNARVGDRRSPIRVWGGVAFWPRNEANYQKKMTKKSRNLALNSLLTLKLKDSLIFGLKDFSVKIPKTKDAVDVISSMWLSDKKVLLVIDQKDETLLKSFRNIEGVKYILLDYLNPVDLMTFDVLIVMESALKRLNEDK